MHVSDEVRRYAIDLVSATRTSPELRLGASPRATLHLVRAARAAAALEGRDFVLPDDIQALAVSVLAHRLLPTAEAQIGRRTTEQIVADLVDGGAGARPGRRRAPRPPLSAPPTETEGNHVRPTESEHGEHRRPRRAARPG